MATEPNNFDKYLPFTEGYGLTVEERQRLITSVVSVVRAHIDSAWGFDPTDAALRAGLSKSFSKASSPATLPGTRRDTFNDLATEGATNTQTLKEVSEDDEQRPSQSDHIYPSI